MQLDKLRVVMNNLRNKGRMGSVELEHSTDEDLDRFSELREDIIHHILSFVPIKDAGRTCILSRTWKSICSSYNILSSLHYDHNSFALQLLLDTKSGQQEPEIYEIRDQFMAYADKDLSRVIQQQFRVLKLALDVAVVDSEFAPVDQFMELLQKAKVEELSTFVQTRDFCWYDAMYDGVIFYNFPYSFLLASEQLQSLAVQGCRFTSELSLPGDNLINNNAGMFSSLRQLCLSQVMLMGEEALTNIASCCPGIEVVEFICCTFWFLTTLKLSKFPKLKKATVSDYQHGLQYVDVTETKLESFDCSTLEMECLFDRAACSNIRELSLHYCSVNEPDLLEDLTTYFPLLEKADLFAAAPSEGLDRITAANPHLRTLKLVFDTVIQAISIECPNLRHFSCAGAGFEEVYFDCPKLTTFHYNAGGIPRLILLDLPTDVECVSFDFHESSVLGTSWFVSLSKFLEQIRGRGDLYLHLSISDDMVEIVLDEFGAVQTFQPDNVHLQLEILSGGVAAAFLDALIWSTRPTTLSIGGWCYGFVKHLCEKLAEKSRDISCCGQQLCNKYWWHNISDFEVQHSHEDMKQNLASLVDMCKQSRMGLPDGRGAIDHMPILFKFEWHSIERFIAKFLVEMTASNPHPNSNPNPNP